MTKEEAIKIINCYDIGFYDLSGEKIPADKLAEAFDMAIEALKERPTGKWIDRSDGGRILYPWWETCECSQCGEYGSGAYDFCPNCGADMRGDSDDIRINR